MQKTNIQMAIECMREMAEAVSDTPKQQAALTAVTAIIADLDDWGPYNVLTSLISHLTYTQPDRLEALRFLINGVLVCWDTADKKDQEDEVQIAVQERQTEILH